MKKAELEVLNAPAQVPSESVTGRPVPNYQVQGQKVVFLPETQREHRLLRTPV
jgi:hypothetical protein